MTKEQLDQVVVINSVMIMKEAAKVLLLKEETTKLGRELNNMAICLDVVYGEKKNDND